MFSVSEFMEIASISFENGLNLPESDRKHDDDTDAKKEKKRKRKRDSSATTKGNSNSRKKQCSDSNEEKEKPKVIKGRRRRKVHSAVNISIARERKVRVKATELAKTGSIDPGKGKSTIQHGSLKSILKRYRTYTLNMGKLSGNIAKAMKGIVAKKRPSMREPENVEKYLVNVCLEI